jgi:hypothetical protein
MKGAGMDATGGGRRIAGWALKGLLGLIGALLLNALGNGVWEWFLRDFLNWSGTALLKSGASLMAGYVDTLHQRIGLTLSNDTMAPTLAQSFFAVMPASAFAAWLLLHRAERRTAVDVATPAVSRHARKAALRRRLLLLIAVTVGLMMPATGLMLIEANYTRRAALWAERSIEIVAPAISENERLLLRAQLRAVQSADQFYKLYDRIRALKVPDGLKLPTFEPIGYPAKAPAK